MSSKYCSLKTYFYFYTNLTFFKSNKKKIKKKWKELLVADFLPEGSFFHVQPKMRDTIKAYVFKSKAKLLI